MILMLRLVLKRKKNPYLPYFSLACYANITIFFLPYHEHDVRSCYHFYVCRHVDFLISIPLLIYTFKNGQRVFETSKIKTNIFGSPHEYDLLLISTALLYKLYEMIAVTKNNTFILQLNYKVMCLRLSVQ